MRHLQLTVGKRYTIQHLSGNNSAVLSLDSVRMFAKTPRRPDLDGSFSRTTNRRYGLLSRREGSPLE